MKLHQYARHELIGKRIMVVDADNRSLIGKHGEIEDETQQMLLLKNGVKLLKSQVRVEICFEDQKIILDGKSLVGRSEERVKKK